MTSTGVTLPVELLEHIMLYCDAESFANIARMCRVCGQLSLTPRLRTNLMIKYPRCKTSKSGKCLSKTVVWSELIDGRMHGEYRHELNGSLVETGHYYLNKKDGSWISSSAGFRTVCVWKLGVLQSRIRYSCATGAKFSEEYYTRGRVKHRVLYNPDGTVRGL